MTGLAEPDYDATISFGLPIEPEDSQYGKYRLKPRSLHPMATSSPKSVRATMERALGAESLSNDPAGYSIDGLHPKVVVAPNDPQRLSQAMSAAWEEGMAVAPWGGGTRMQLGNAIRRLDVIVDLSRLNRVVQHNPADLTVTVEAGTTVTSLQQGLAEHGQFLALDPPLPDRASIGGTLAARVSGPLRWQYGNARDLVLGMKVVQADGKVTKSGGQVVKNVSGYDMARLHVGGLGTLGIISEVSFKLTPLPRNQATVLAAFDSGRRCIEAGLGVSHSHVLPLALTAFDSSVNRRSNVTGLDASHLLAIRLGGRPRTLERQVSECSWLCLERGATTVERLDEDDTAPLWRRLADFGWDENTTPAVAGTASLLPTEVADVTAAVERSNHTAGLRPAIVSHPGYGNVLINWFSDGNAPSEEEVSAVLHQTRDAVHLAGGRLIIERCPQEVKSRLDVWDDIGEPLAIMRRMKEQYDPRGILNPGRFAGGI